MPPFVHLFAIAALIGASATPAVAAEPEPVASNA